jgi:hypothetical protein
MLWFKKGSNLLIFAHVWRAASDTMAKLSASHRSTSRVAVLSIILQSAYVNACCLIFLSMSNILGWHTCNHEMARETLIDDSTRSNMPCRVSRCVIATELKERFPEVPLMVFSRGAWCVLEGYCMVICWHIALFDYSLTPCSYNVTVMTTASCWVTML